MIIGIVSDSHDNMDAVKAAVDVLRDNGAELVLHAGDIVAPFAAKGFLELGIPIEAVFGNNDGEKTILSDLLPGISAGSRKLKLDGKTVVVIHDRKKAISREVDLADVLVHGHTHVPEVKREGKRIEVNPGELCGWVTGKRSLVIWDTEADLPEIVEL